MIFTAEDILTRLRTRPFVPLRIVTSTGERYDVFHPDLILVTRRFLEVGTPDSDNPSVADMVTRVALVHIVELRDLPTPVAGPSEAA